MRADAGVPGSGSSAPAALAVGDRVLACRHLDCEAGSWEGYAYVWSGLWEVVRAVPPTTFVASWLVLCAACHLRFAEEQEPNAVIAQDFILSAEPDRTASPVAN